MEVKVGMIIGRRKVLERFDRGPYAYVRTECQCEHKTVGVQPLGKLLKGECLSCAVCYRDDLRAACAQVRAKRKAQGEKIRLKFAKSA